ncbi:trichohyalin isoform X2 [Thalassophryne amazonica]|uniref:trichohyalin isoform X2 n=1 Tax=Thalassophryne amazonica TaxID=390379 RepID=UPI00147209FD|nr:trichohyalin isoform X2 [Thalassophryne amazonica]
METKRNNWTLGDTLSKLHPGGKISRDPSPKPGSTAQSERERQRIPEDEWRREREMEKMRDRIRYKEKDVYLQERCDERDTVSAPRARPDEREWRERKKRREEDRSKSGGLLSNVDRETERVMKKGDTFPRIAKHVADCGRRTAEIVKDRIGNRQMDRGERKEKRERERAWQRERYRETEDLRLRATEEGRLRGEEKAQREKYRDYDVSFQERRRGRHLEVADIRDIRERERDAHSTQEKDRSYMRAKGRRTPSPYQRRDQETCLQTKDRKKEGRRDTKSEGDSDETESRKDRLRDREELIYQHSRSEGDNKGKPAREKHHERQGYREEDRVRQTGQEWHSRNDRKLEKEFNREAERWKENASDRKRFTQDDRTRTNDRRQDDRYREREYEERRARERKEREVDPVRRREMSAKVAPQSHSSGEWSSDMDSDARYRRGRDTNEEGIGEIDAEETGSQEGIAKGRERELKESRRRDRDGAERTGGAQERRRMWLEPQRGNKSKESHLEEERERHLRQEERRNEQEREVESQMEHGVKEEKDERCWDQRDARGRHTDDREHRRNMEHMEKRGAEEREIEGISLDKEEVGEVWGEGDKGGGKVHLSNSDGSNEGSRLNEVESENMTDDMEESDTEERGGSDYYAHSESEGGSERGWVQDWDKRLSAEDEFVTVSSGGEREEEEFQDCREFWEGGIPPVDFERYGQEKEREDEWRVGEEMVDENGEVQENEKQPKYVYCVIGQTWPPTKRREASGSHQTCREERECLNVESHDHDSDDIIQHTEDDQHPRLGRNDDYMISNRDREVTSERNENNMPDEDTLNKDTDETTDVDVGCRASTESMGKKVEHLHAEMNTVKRDSQTEKLLMEWREKNKEQTEREKEQASQIPAIHSAGIDAQGTFQQTTLAGINTGSISLEEEEASRIHVSRTWSMSEETKRRSQAPHLKWAKTVVRQILGTSDEQSIDDPNSGSEQGDSRCELTMENDKQGVDVAQETGEVFSCAKVEELRTDEPQSEAELEEEEPLELEGLRDDEDSKSDSWGEVDLRNVLDTIGRRKRNSKFFNFAQLYQQYSETVQNIEILQQSRSCAVSVNENTAQLPSTSPSSSPSPSPRPACRPLPPLPDVPHPHSLSKTVSVTSVKSLPLPEPPRTEGRAHSPRLSISLTQSATLWRELPGVRNSEEIDMLTEDQRRLQEVRFEVVTSEASYCRSLDIVVEHFVKSKQLGALLSTQDRNWLFSRLADVRAISHSFLSKLEEQVESDILHFSVCDIIARHCQRFRMVYVPYLTNQSYQDATYQRLMNENPAFKRIVEKLERSPLCQRLPLRSFLVLPFQRITRIKLLVQNIVKRTTPGTTEAAQAIKSLKLLEKLIQESNNSITQMKSIESLVSLSAKVDFECRTLPLISQARRLVREGPVTELMDFSLKDTERNIYLHLFNDYLLLSQQKEGGRFTVIDHCPVSDLRAENCRVKLYSLQENLFRLHMTNKALLLRTDTQSDKLRWISALSRPHPEIDFSAAQDFPQMQCIKAFVGQQPDELTLDKADIILVHQQSSDHWVEGTRLSDRHRGWVPESHLETITNPRVLQRNLSDAQKIKTATAAV